MKYDLTPFKSLYLQTARVYLAEMKKDIESIRKDSSDRFAINNMFISSHSLASQSSVMEYMKISELCQLLERIFHALKEQNSSVTDSLLSTVSESLDHIEASLKQIEEAGNESDLSKDIQVLEFTIKKAKGEIN